MRNSIISALILCSALAFSSESLGSQDFTPFGEVDSTGKIVIFNTDNVPRQARAGREVVSTGRLLGGILYTPFPYTFEVSGKWQADTRDLSLYTGYMSYFAENWSFSAGKQNAVWGFGNFVQPLYYMDFVEPENVDFLTVPEYRKLWQAGVSSFADATSLTLNVLTDFDSIMEGRQPDWSAALFSHQFNHDGLAVNSEIGYLDRPGSRDIIAGIEVKNMISSELSLFYSQSAIRNMADDTYVNKFAAGAEMQFFDKMVMVMPELGFDGSYWLSGAVVSFSPRNSHFTISDSCLMELIHGGIRNTLRAELRMRNHFSTALQLTNFKGNDTSMLGSKNIPAIFQWTIKVSFK